MRSLSYRYTPVKVTSKRKIQKMDKSPFQDGLKTEPHNS